MQKTHKRNKAEEKNDLIVILVNALTTYGYEVKDQRPESEAREYVLTYAGKKPVNLGGLKIRKVVLCEDEENCDLCRAFLNGQQAEISIMAVGGGHEVSILEI